jgi:hypothetical protein
MIQRLAIDDPLYFLRQVRIGRSFAVPGFHAFAGRALWNRLIVHHVLLPKKQKL